MNQTQQVRRGKSSTRLGLVTGPGVTSKSLICVIFNYDHLSEYQQHYSSLLQSSQYIIDII